MVNQREVDGLLEQAQRHLEEVSAYRHDTDLAKQKRGEALGAAKECIRRARLLTARRAA